jgi:hypothetical protein
MKTKLMQVKKTKDFISILVKEYGYQEGKKNGSSHRIFRSDNRPTLSIPNTTEMARGTQRDLTKLVLGEEYYNI